MVDVSDVFGSPPKRIEKIRDVETGLEGVIVIHSTRLGPAAGGCRFRPYAGETAMITDALRLAAAMSYKNALAGLPFGGGQAVLRRPAGEIDRPALFRAFGRAVRQLDGDYVTTADAGSSMSDMAHVAEETRHVAGLPARAGRAGGDPALWTALGTFRAMEVAARRRLGAPLSDLTVAVQGLGAVGAELCRLLHGAGATLLVADTRSEAVARVATAYGAMVVPAHSVAAAKADIFAPCAMGGTLDAPRIATMRAAVVCGSASSQLARAEDGERLAARGILHAPDIVVNAGGIISVAAEVRRWKRGEVETRVAAIGPRLEAVFDRAEADGIDPARAADLMARALISRPRARVAESVAA